MKRGGQIAASSGCFIRNPFKPVPEATTQQLTPLLGRERAYDAAMPRLRQVYRAGDGERAIFGIGQHHDDRTGRRGQIGLGGMSRDNDPTAHRPARQPNLWGRTKLQKPLRVFAISSPRSAMSNVSVTRGARIECCPPGPADGQSRVYVADRMSRLKVLIRPSFRALDNLTVLAFVMVGHGSINQDSRAK